MDSEQDAADFFSTFDETTEMAGCVTLISPTPKVIYKFCGDAVTCLEIEGKKVTFKNFETGPVSP